jgi:hypothetical protein
LTKEIATLSLTNPKHARCAGSSSCATGFPEFGTIGIV